MGYVLAGNLGTARKGFHFQATTPPSDLYKSSNFSVSQLLNSILDMAGVQQNGQPVPEFGLRGYIQKAGVPRRIDALFA
jgi:hypothetical protein